MVRIPFDVLRGGVSVALPRIQGRAVRGGAAAAILGLRARGFSRAIRVAFLTVGEPTLEKGFDEAVTRSVRIVKRSLDASADEIADELREALKG